MLVRTLAIPSLLSPPLPLPKFPAESWMEWWRQEWEVECKRICPIELVPGKVTFRNLAHFHFLGFFSPSGVLRFSSVFFSSLQRLNCSLPYKCGGGRGQFLLQGGLPTTLESFLLLEHLVSVCSSRSNIECRREIKYWGPSRHVDTPPSSLGEGKAETNSKYWLDLWRRTEGEWGWWIWIGLSVPPFPVNSAWARLTDRLEGLMLFLAGIPQSKSEANSFLRVCVCWFSGEQVGLISIWDEWI